MSIPGVSARRDVDRVSRAVVDDRGVGEVARSGARTLHHREAVLDVCGGEVAEDVGDLVIAVGPELHGRLPELGAVGRVERDVDRDGSAAGAGETDVGAVVGAVGIELAESVLETDGDSPTVMTDLASYYAMVGQRDRGNELLETVTRQEIRDPLLMGSIAESFEDLGDRDQAIEWLGRALNDGLDIKWLERRPSFNSLRSDERFLEIVQKSTKSS